MSEWKYLHNVQTVDKYGNRKNVETLVYRQLTHKEADDFKFEYIDKFSDEAKTYIFKQEDIEWWKEQKKLREQ